MNVAWNNAEAREKYLKKTKEAFFYSEQSKNTVNQALIKIHTYDYRLHRKWREQRMLRNGVTIMEEVALAQ